jgi:hypothetical protein
MGARHVQMLTSPIQWPPLPHGPPPSPSRRKGHAYRTRIFVPPTLAPLEECQLGYAGRSDEHSRIPPGSPWASGTRKAWVLDEQVLWRRRDSIVHEVRQWITTGVELSAQAQSNLGLDPFLYQLHGLLLPSPERFAALRQKLDQLSLMQPDDLYRAVHYEQLSVLLGEQFDWVQLPKTKTNADSPKRKAW